MSERGRYAVNAEEPPSDGFWMKTPRGVVAHVTGDRNMSDESAKALSEVIEAAYDRLKELKHG